MASQEVILASLKSGVDLTLIAESLAMTPTQRLETMRRAALSLERAKRAAGRLKDLSDLAEIREIRKLRNQ